VCLGLIAVAWISRCSLDVASTLGDAWTEAKQSARLFEDAFGEEPHAAFESVKLCVINGERALAVKWHPTSQMSEPEMEAVSDRVWSRVSSSQDAPEEPVILAVVETSELGPIRSWKRHQAIVYGGTLTSDTVSDCLDD
jgi:hypothetical protein